MAENSKIEWTDHTFNPWIGCTKVSPACGHCYAEVLSKRHGWAEWGNHPRKRTSEATWKQPLAWNRRAAKDGIRRKVFCASLADVFDNQVPAEWRADLWRLIRATPNLDWLLLTKRPQNIARMLPDPETGVKPWGNGWPNVWLGTTVENQEEADRRIPALLAVPAAKHFLSCEPLLGPVDLTRISTAKALTSDEPDWLYNSLSGEHYFVDDLGFSYGGDGPVWSAIDWVICGGESGPSARPMHPDWARLLRDQCNAAGVPFFFKQWGEWVQDEYAFRHCGEVAQLKPHQISADDQAIYYRVGKKGAGAMLDGREWREFPDMLASGEAGRG